MQRVRENQKNFSTVMYSDSFRKQVQGKAAFVLDTPEMRRVRETQRIISGYQQAKTVELQQRSSSVATQQTTVSSVPSHPSTTGKTVRAMYDYAAADGDEVSFKDGDVIVNVQSIDEGWMYGTVQRTGKTGMLPANYVEAI
uniref:Nebulin n=1 Tax=Nothobranchius korthausae TaxID=1143690 RepID=A0A1A8GMZ6_9TELE